VDSLIPVGFPRAGARNTAVRLPMEREGGGKHEEGKMKKSEDWDASVSLSGSKSGSGLGGEEEDVDPELDASMEAFLNEPEPPARAKRVRCGAGRGWRAAVRGN
jgi:hypothetical protein